MDAESRGFRALAEERDLYAAYALLLPHRERLHELLRARHRRRLGDVEIELAVEDALGRARDWAFSFDPARGSLRSWLDRIAENCARNALAARRAAVGSEGLERIAAREPRDERLQEVRVERLIVTARYRARAFPDVRLGRWLGCTIGHVQNRRSSILRRLREELGGRDG